MRLSRLWLEDFRSHQHLDLTFGPGITVITGRNGAGKTNVVEAIGWLSRAGSFRVQGNEALVRRGAERAIVRAELVEADRRVLLEAEIPIRGRPRIQLNRQRLSRAGDLSSSVRVTVFSPDDLQIVKGGPAGRREFLDDSLAALSAKAAAALGDLDRVLRQRNALLAGCGGRLDDGAARTLDVWDEKLAAVGSDVIRRRTALIERLDGPAIEACHVLSGEAVAVSLEYAPSFTGELGEALAQTRAQDVRRGVTTTGPHRDELTITLSGMPARTHASQAEQRTLALALRVGAHRVCTEATGTSPILVLDDVFSELDEERAAALLRAVPAGQTIITAAAVLPTAIGTGPDVVVHHLERGPGPERGP